MRKNLFLKSTTFWAATKTLNRVKRCRNLAMIGAIIITVIKRSEIGSLWTILKSFPGKEERKKRKTPRAITNLNYLRGKNRRSRVNKNKNEQWKYRALGVRVCWKFNVWLIAMTTHFDNGDTLVEYFWSYRTNSGNCQLYFLGKVYDNNKI